MRNTERQYLEIDWGGFLDQPIHRFALLVCGQVVRDSYRDVCLREHFRIIGDDHTLGDFVRDLIAF